MAEALRGVDGNDYSVGEGVLILGDYRIRYQELGEPIPIPTAIDFEIANKVTKQVNYQTVFTPDNPDIDVLILGTNTYFCVQCNHFSFTDGRVSYYSYNLRQYTIMSDGTKNYYGGIIGLPSNRDAIEQKLVFVTNAHRTGDRDRLQLTYNWGGDSYWSIQTTTDILSGPYYNTDNIELTDVNFSDIVPTSSKGGTGATIVGDLFQIVSDKVDPPSLPNISAVGCGMVTLYAPTLAQINALSDVLWSSDTDFFENLSKLWSNPLECIVGIGIYPLQPPTGTVSTVKLGTLNTGVNMSKLSNQYTSFNCGSVKVKQFFGNALDYSPYTKVSLYIPFHGVELLNVDEVMGATVNVTYNIDFLSGGFVATLTIKKDNLDAVLYHFSGNMMTPIPITSNNYMGLYQSLMQGASGLTQFATGNVMGGVSTMASAVMSKKMTVSRSGSLSGNTGILDNMKPYFIIERPMQSLASNYNKFEGFPSNITAKLSTLKGYTSVESLKSNTLTCPQVEQDEIITLLKGGVFL